jgi:hypothetical protein
MAKKQDIYTRLFYTNAKTIIDIYNQIENTKHVGLSYNTCLKVNEWSNGLKRSVYMLLNM